MMVSSSTQVHNLVCSGSLSGLLPYSCLILKVTVMILKVSATVTLLLTQGQRTDPDSAVMSSRQGADVGAVISNLKSILKLITDKVMIVTKCKQLISQILVLCSRRKELMLVDFFAYLIVFPLLSLIFKCISSCTMLEQKTNFSLVEHLKEDMKLIYQAQELISTDPFAPQSWCAMAL